jgi:tRNA (guanine10-N2)-dimethyltransferase
MKVLFELAKEFQDIPQHEALATLTAENVGYFIITSNEDVMVVDVDGKNRALKRVAGRLALSYCIDEFIFSCKPTLNELSRLVEANTLGVKGSIAIHARNRSSMHKTQPIIHILAERYTPGHEVDLENPDVDIRVLITDDEWYIGRKLAMTPRRVYEQRRAHHRPFFSPISLHPKLARAFVNLSGIKKDEVFLDPFCGTGGFLIEAGFVGARIIGNDIEEKMIKGCANTLRHFGINKFHLITGDVERLIKVLSPVDAIVTDMPYGKSTTTCGEPIERLYTRAFSVFKSLLKNDGCLIVGSASPSIVAIARDFFSVDAVYPIRVHRSLTRYFVCCRE